MMSTALLDKENLELLDDSGVESAGSPDALPTEAKPQKKACFVGVRFHGECRTNPWEARCRAGGRKHNLGYFATAQEAARAYDAFARQFGRKLNFPDDELPANYAYAPHLPLAAEPATSAHKRSLEPDNVHVGTHTGFKVLHELQLPHFEAAEGGRRDDDCDVTPTDATIDGFKRPKILFLVTPTDATIGAAHATSASPADLDRRSTGRRVLNFRPLEQAGADARLASPALVLAVGRAMHSAGAPALASTPRGAGACGVALLETCQMPSPWTCTPSNGPRAMVVNDGYRTVYNDWRTADDDSCATNRRAHSEQMMHAASSLLCLSAGLVA